MVKVIIKFKNNNINSFEFRGHANSAEYGQDIVCASVSGISQTILLGLIDILDDNIKYKIESGYLYFIIPNNIDVDILGKVNVLTNTLMLGKENIKKNYSEYIYIKKEEV